MDTELGYNDRTFKTNIKTKIRKKANIKEIWTDNHNKAFKNLKEMLSKIVKLGYYDVKDRTQVIADASPVGLGAVLLQIDCKGPRIIAFANRTLSQCERKYS